MMLIDEKFKIGQIVYLKTDKEQVKMIVTALLIDTNGIEYRLSSGNISAWHHDIEISEEVSILEITTR